MSTMIKLYTGTRPLDKEVQLRVYQYDDGSIHYSFIGRNGLTAGNPTEEEAQDIIRHWKLEEER